jgi:hypothetical protein
MHYDKEFFEKEFKSPIEKDYKFHNFIDRAYDKLKSRAGFQELRAVALGGSNLKIGRNEECIWRKKSKNVVSNKKTFICVENIFLHGGHGAFLLLSVYVNHEVP